MKGHTHSLHSRAKTKSADRGEDWRKRRVTGYTQWRGQDKVSRWRRGLEEGQTHTLHTVEGPRQGQQMEEGTGGGADSHATNSGRAKTRSEDGGGDWRRGRLTSYTQWKGQDKVRRWRREWEQADTQARHSGRAKTRSEDGGGHWRRGRLTRYKQWKGQDKVSRWRRLEEGETHKLGTVKGPRQGQQMEEGTGGGADSQARHSERGQQMEEGTGGGADSHATHSGRAKTRSEDGGGDWRRGRLTI